MFVAPSMTGMQRIFKPPKSGHYRNLERGIYSAARAIWRINSAMEFRDSSTLFYFRPGLCRKLRRKLCRIVGRTIVLPIEYFRTTN